MKCFLQKRRNRRSRRRAQTLVETALVLSLVLLPTLLGFLQYGAIIYTAHALQSVAREGARFAAVHAGETTFDDAVTQSNPPSLRNYLQTVCASTNIGYADLTGNITATSTPRLYVTPDASRISGQPITVRITYPMSKKFFVGKIVPLVPRDFTATATFLLE